MAKKHSLMSVIAAAYTALGNTMSSEGEQIVNTFKDGGEVEHLPVVTTLSAEMEDKLGTLTDTQKRAAYAALAFSMSPESYVNGEIPSDATRMQTPNFSGQAVAPVVRSVEEYTGADPRALQAFNFAINAKLAVQDPYVEAFFPTVVNDKGIAGASVTLLNTYINKPVVRGNGEVAIGQDKVSVTEVMANGSIFDDDNTVLIPNIKGDANLDKFLDTSFKTTVTSGGESFDSAPYKLGVKIPVLDVASTPGMLAAGALTGEDSFEPGVVLEKIYGTLDGNNVVLDVSSFAGSTFTGTLSGNMTDITMHMDIPEFKIAFNTLVDETGAAATLPAELTGKVGVYDLSVVGSGNAQDGILDVSVIRLNLVRVESATGVVITDAATTAKANTLTAKAYKVYAKASNETIRNFGLNITSEPKTEVYEVKGLTPLRVNSPIAGLQRGVSHNANLTIDEVLNFATAAISQNGFATLKNVFEALRQASASGALTANSVKGIGKYIARPAFVYDTMNIASELDSVSSDRRASEIKAIVTNKVRVVVSQLVSESGFLSTARALKGQDVKVTVVVGLPEELAMFVGKEMDLGNNYDVEIVSSTRQEVAGQINVALKVKDDSNEVNILSFGNTIFTPTLAAEVAAMNLNGGTVKSLIVQPVVNHEINHYVGARIDVTGINDAIKKITVNTHNV